MSTYLAAQVDDIRLAYRDVKPSGTQRGIIVLARPALLTDKGYRCIAPDYREAGGSSKPENGFTKSTMADDIAKLLDYLHINGPVHLIGHAIEGMIAFVFARRHPQRLKSVCWGECPLPSTKTYYRDRTEHAVQQFHFIFHGVPDLPEALIKGNERIYISHFLNKIAYNLSAFTEADIDHYAAAYSQPGAMRCGLDVYRACEMDAEVNRAAIEQDDNVDVPTLVLNGEHSRHQAEAEEMVHEVTEKEKVEVGVVSDAGHYLVEEHPEGFVRTVLKFVSNHT